MHRVICSNSARSQTGSLGHFAISTKKKAISSSIQKQFCECIRSGVKDTRLEAKAKDTKKIRGQGQPFRGQTLSRPRTGMLEAKDHGHKRKCSPKKKGLHKNFSSAPQNFNNSKNSAVLEQRTGQFSRT